MKLALSLSFSWVFLAYTGTESTQIDTVYILRKTDKIPLPNCRFLIMEKDNLSTFNLL
jgi:hypothetical protein